MLEMLKLFLLRAAMKMANIDAVFEYMFTSPKKSNGVGMAYISLFSLYFIYSRQACLDHLMYSTLLIFVLDLVDSLSMSCGERNGMLGDLA